jgi:hypothetical protein
MIMAGKINGERVGFLRASFYSNRRRRNGKNMGAVAKMLILRHGRPLCQCRADRPKTRNWPQFPLKWGRSKLAGPKCPSHFGMYSLLCPLDAGIREHSGNMAGRPSQWPGPQYISAVFTDSLASWPALIPP